MRRVFQGLLLLGLIFWPMELRAQSQELTDAIKQAEELYQAERFREAIPYVEKGVSLGEQEYGSNDPRQAELLNVLAFLYEYDGQYAKAEPLYKRVLTIQEEALGLEHLDVAESLNILASVYLYQSRYSEAEPLYKRALAIREKALGLDHQLVATILNNLALLHNYQGRYAEAELLYKRSISITERVLGLEHPEVATSLDNLGALYSSQGRYDQAELLHQRALKIRETTLGSDPRDLATSLDNLATVYRLQGRLSEAEFLLERNVAVLEKALGSRHPDLATCLNNLAILYQQQGRYEDAASLHVRALAIRIAALGAHRAVADSLYNLAAVYQDQSYFGNSEKLYKRALFIQEQTLGPMHPDVARIWNNLAMLYGTQGRFPEALDAIREASAIQSDRAVQSVSKQYNSQQSEQKSVRSIFVNHADIVFHLLKQEPSQRRALASEGFDALQFVQVTSAALAVSRMSARLEPDDKDLAEIARAHQDAVEQWQRLEKALISALSQTPDKRDLSEESRIRADLEALDREITALEEQLVHEFPEYSELTNPRPLSLADAQNLLAQDEALISYAVANDRTLLWVVTKDRVKAHRLDIDSVNLASRIRGLRAALSPYVKLQSFDISLAHKLYEQIFAPTEQLLGGIKHIFMVLDGPLQSLPFGVLVTDEIDISDLRKVPWLARKYAITTLPSVSSLRALRQYAKASKAEQPFLGVGDPILSGHPTTAPEIELSGLFSLRGVGDVEAVRSLSSLPETAVELEALADNLTASPGSVLLREEATEPNLRSIDLERYRVLAFATHAVVAGELKGFAEPALVLTPPDVATEVNDGLLTASEIATLKLDADWVILSACNTAAPDGTPGAEALSGLAKAFFYAGSRALLVSHWPVSSDAAVELTTRMFSEYAKEPSIGRAEALRRSMMALMDDPNYAHPFYWAPFVIVGEGGVAN